MTTKTINPVWHAIIVYLSHSSSWTLIVGVVLGIVAAGAPRWAGLDNLTTVCDNLALLLPVVFGLIAGAQKFADAKSQGETSAYNQWLRQAALDKAANAIEGKYTLEEMAKTAVSTLDPKDVRP